MKNILLKLGAITAIITPIATVVACGSKTTVEDDKTTTEKEKANVFSGGAQSPKTIKELKSQLSYYSDLQDNATGEELFNQLRSVQSKYLEEVGSYKDLWTTYKDAFIDKYQEVDQTILDIYSENPNGPDPYNFKPGTDQDQGNHKKEGDSYNREHMVPQSIFGKDAEHIHNDAHFIFPTDSFVNQERSNFPYGDVVNVEEEFEQGGKLGTNSNGDKVFEPIDAFKGDVARATLYFVLTWKDTKWDEHTATFEPFEGNTIGGMKKDFFKIYLSWSNLDTLSKFDQDRNNAIAKDEHGIRNPFVDMPKLIDLIWGTTGGVETSKTNTQTPTNQGTSTPTHETDHATTSKSVVLPKTPIDLSQINIDDYLVHDVITGLIASKRTAAIKTGWPDVVEKAKTIEDLVNMVTKLAYGDNQDSRIIENILSWANKLNL